MRGFLFVTFIVGMLMVIGGMLDRLSLGTAMTTQPAIVVMPQVIGAWLILGFGLITAAISTAGLAITAAIDENAKIARDQDSAVARGMQSRAEEVLGQLRILASITSDGAAASMRMASHADPTTMAPSPPPGAASETAKAAARAIWTRSDEPIFRDHPGDR